MGNLPPWMAPSKSVLCIPCAALLVGCDSDTSFPFDADAFVCFDGDPPAEADPSGTVEIGTAEVEREPDFEPVDEDQELPLFAGPQGGYHFDVFPRIQNIHPGDPEQPRAEENPHTLLSAYDEDGDRLDIHECGLALPYPVERRGYHLLEAPRRLMFSRDVGGSLEGERVKIAVAVLGADGHYARDETWIVAGEIRYE